MRFGSFTYLLKQGAKNAYLNKAMSFASVGVLAACLILVGSAALFSKNIQNLIGFVQQQNEIIVYLDDELSADVSAQLDRQIRAMPNVVEATYTSKEKAFENQREKLGNLLDGYENENVFPASYHLQIRNLSEMQQDVDTLTAMAGVYRVDAPTDVADVMLKTDRGISVAGTVVVAALLVVSFVIIINTIKITVFSRRREINIMKYVGATNHFIRMPFLIEGMILGGVSALLAFLVVFYLYDRIYNALAGNLTAWMSSAAASLIPFSDIALPLALLYLAAGVLIGALGSMLSVRKHLKV